LPCSGVHAISGQLETEIFPKTRKKRLGKLANCDHEYMRPLGARHKYFIRGGKGSPFLKDWDVAASQNKNHTRGKHVWVKEEVPWRLIVRNEKEDSVQEEEQTG